MTEKEFEERKAMCLDLFLYYVQKINYETEPGSLQDILKQVDVILDMYLDLVKQ